MVVPVTLDFRGSVHFFVQTYSRMSLSILPLVLTRNPVNEKQANITSDFKKGERYSKGNYRPISIMSSVSKIFERCMFRQINEYMDVFL